jgi:hypothetical protein
MTMNKTIWAEPIGPSITAYDDKGQIIVVVPFDRGASWFSRPITTSERRKVEKAVNCGPRVSSSDRPNSRPNKDFEPDFEPADPILCQECEVKRQA